MLIVSIPKSASTSILKTLSNLHKLDGSQLFFKDYKIPATFNLLGKYHSDVREFQSVNINVFLQNNKVYKQHIPPTINNLNLLRNKKKVILLRNPKDIIMAYYRADKKLLHEKRKGFKDVHNLEEWFQTLKKELFKEKKDLYNC